MEIHVRVWVNTDDYTTVFYRINEQVYALLLSEGIFEKNTSSTLDVN
jgi:small-conductance mechanosensitive channel